MPRLAFANATQLRQAKPRAKDWRIGCGQGLYLRITPTGFKYWQVRYRQSNDKETIRQFGSYPNMSLEQARAWRDDFFGSKTQATRQSTTQVVPHRTGPTTPVGNRAALATALTFRECAERLIQSKTPEWRNEKHAQQWSNTLQQYAMPILGSMPIEHVSREHVLACLEPIWLTKNETATRLRGRIESVLNWAKAHNLVQGDNPAGWKGGLQNLLAAPGKVKKVQSHAAMPYDEIPAFMQLLRLQSSLSAVALRWLILTATRTSEVLHAQWAELIDPNLWAIPAERMKADRDHRVPLSLQAASIRDSLPKQGKYLFGTLQHRRNADTGTREVEQRPMSNMAMSALLARLKCNDYTVHGFRSSFRDWAADNTTFPREICEHALAHRLPDKTEAAYLRTEWLKQRRELMQAWADFICPSE